MKLGYLYGIIYGLVAVVIFQVFARPIFGLFTTNEELLEIGPRALRIVIAMMWLMGISHATMGAHQAMGKAKSAFVLAIQRWILLITPMILFLPYVFNLGLDGVWLAFIPDCISFFLPAKQLSIILMLYQLPEHGF
jgi:Na+-driven multidrug efflux pump